MWIHIEFAPLSGAQTPDRHIGGVHGCIVDVKDAGARLAVAHEGASVPLPPSSGLRFHLAQPVENATAHLEAGKHLNKDGFAMSTAMLHAIAQREFEKWRVAGSGVYAAARQGCRCPRCFCV